MSLSVDSLVVAALSGVTLCFCAGLAFRRRDHFWMLLGAFPALYLVVECAERGIKIAAEHSFRWQRHKEFDAEVVALLDGLRSSFEAGLNFDAALSHQRARRRWCSACGPVLDVFLAARGAGLSLFVSISRAAQALSGDGDARFLKAALLCLAEGTEKGAELSKIASAFAEKCRMAQQMRQKALALSAQVRFQASVLLCAPPLLALVLGVLRSGYVDFFLGDSLGITLTVVMVCLHLAALVALRRIRRGVGIQGG